MIIRNGQRVINNTRMHSNEILDIIKQGQYVSPNNKKVDISKQIAFSRDNSIYYKDNPPIKEFTPIRPKIEVVNEKTISSAIRLHKQNAVALSFANAKTPGGGFLLGAKAQEEDICRASALYECIKNKPNFYNDNILKDNFYTHGMIYSPNVPFFKDEELLEEPFNLSIITCPAANLNGIEDKTNLVEKLETLYKERMVKILQVAAYHGHKTIILGAWGCGAFCNDPKLVANAFSFALNQVPAFEHVCFPVYDIWDKSIALNKYDVFKEILETNVA